MTLLMFLTGIIFILSGATQSLPVRHPLSGATRQLSVPMHRVPVAMRLSENPDVSQLRALYYNAASNKDAAFKLARILKTVNKESPAILVCYKGVSEMMQAKYLLNPLTKMNKFINGKRLIENAVKTNPQGVEIRFLRFCMQTNLPDFLGYNAHINKDKIFLMNNLNHIEDTELKQNISAYLISEANLSKTDN